MYRIRQIVLLVLTLSLFLTLISTVEVAAAPKVRYQLTIEVIGNGNTSPPIGDHTYNEDKVVDITAIPDAGWQFDGWSGDVADPNSASTTVTMDGNKTVTAIFTQITHDLTLAVAGDGSTDPAVGVHTYAWGTVVPITATPDPGWQFDSWSGDVADPDSASTTVTIDGDKTVTAIFIQVTYDLTMAVSGNGTTSPPEGAYIYNEGTVIDITATPDSGWQFDGWSGDVANPDSASTTVTIGSNKTVTAIFTQITYDLTMAVNGNGTTSPSEGTYKYNEGDMVDITATPDSGWYFVHWTGGVADPDSASTTVTIDSDKTVTAIFTEMDKVTYDLTMAINGNGTTSPSEGTYTYSEGTDIDITATPDSGWLFVNWSGDVADPNSASTTVNMNADKTVTANFTEMDKVTYTLTMTVNGNGITGPSTGTHIYNEGAIVDITATPDSGWLFDSWSGDVADPNSASTTVAIDNNKTITANFTEMDKVTYTLTMTVNGNGTTGPSLGTHIYNEGAIVDITATPDSGWQFDSWSGDVADPNSADTAVIMNADKTVTANFSQVTGVTHVLTITTDGNGITSPSTGSHSFDKDTVIDITATPDSGWLFDSWSGDVTDPSSAGTTVTMNTNKTITANFTIAVDKLQVDEDQNSSEGNGLLATFIGAIVFLIIVVVVVIVRIRMA